MTCRHRRRNASRGRRHGRWRRNGGRRRRRRRRHGVCAGCRRETGRREQRWRWPHKLTAIQNAVAAGRVAYGAALAAVVAAASAQRATDGGAAQRRTQSGRRRRRRRRCGRRGGRRRCGRRRTGGGRRRVDFRQHAVDQRKRYRSAACASKTVRRRDDEQHVHVRYAADRREVPVVGWRAVRDISIARRPPRRRTLVWRVLAVTRHGNVTYCDERTVIRSAFRSLTSRR